MKRIIVTIAIIILIAIFVVPIPMRLKDGGTVEYKAVLYSISDVHRLASTDDDVCYEDGIIVEILGIEVFNNVKITLNTDNPTETGDPESEPVQLGNDTELTVADAELAYAGTPSTNKIYLNSLNRDKLPEGVRHLPIYRVDTVEELENFKNEFAEELSMDGNYDEVPSFNEVTKKYKESFFEDNTVFIIYIDSTNTTHRYGIESISNLEGHFCIYLQETTGAECVDTAMAGWFLTVAVNKEYVAESAEFDSILNYGYDLVGNTAPAFRQSPHLIVTANESSVVALKGTSSWMYTDEYGKEVAVMSDGNHPLLLKENMPVLAIVPSVYSSVSPTSAILQFGKAPNIFTPDNVTVRCWSAELWGNTDAQSEDIPVRYTNGNIFIELKYGDYVYEVIGEWKGSKSVEGSVCYSFYVLAPSANSIITIDG
ncbi:MAG: hypothetical protein IKT46_04445 [Clostridia bacterium]|nr:hypothetical protein [Clostridia bacterium]